MRLCLDMGLYYNFGGRGVGKIIRLGMKKLPLLPISRDLGENFASGGQLGPRQTDYFL